MEANQLRFYHALSNFWIFATPACKGTADFRGSFKTYLAQSESTNALIENLTRTRTDVVNLLNSAAPLEQRLRAVDEYLPFLYQFYDSLLAHHANSAGVPLRADKDLVFEWRCYLAPNGGLPHFRSNDIVFELIMTLHLKASLHYFTARHLLDLDLIANLTEAGKQLVTASGILDLIEANIKSNKWNRAHYSAPNVPNPAETSVAVLAGLSLYYRSLAQILAIIKGAANTEKPTPLAVKTRLSVAVINMSASALRSLESASFGGTGKFSAWLNFDLLTKVAVNREVFTALAYFYQSKALQEKQEIGASIAYAQFAQFHLAEQPSAKFNSATAGLPKSTGNFANIAAISAYLNSLLAESINENDRTNRFVTFQVVPKALGELPPLPAEAVIMNSQPFKEPVTEDKQLVLFIPPEKKSFFGSLFSKSKSTSKGEGLAAEQGKAATDTPDTDNSSNPPNPPNPAPLPVVQGQVVPNPSASSPAVYVAPGAFAPAPAPALMSPPSVSSTQTGSGITYPSNSHLYPTLTQHPPNQPMPQPPYTQPYAQPPQPYNAPPNTNYYNAAGAPPALNYNPSAPYATPQVMSDEEYARQLQQQYNQESK